MRLLFLVSMICFASGAVATPVVGVEMVIIEKVQKAQWLNGEVVAPAGEPIEGVEVVETASDCETALRSTHSDASGRWSLAPLPKQTLYYLRFNKPEFNPVCIKLKLSNSGEKQLKVKLPVST
jgi:hypothetical protein